MLLSTFFSISVFASAVAFFLLSLLFCISSCCCCFCLSIFLSSIFLATFLKLDLKHIFLESNCLLSLISCFRYSFITGYPCTTSGKRALTPLIRSLCVNSTIFFLFLPNLLNLNLTGSNLNELRLKLLDKVAFICFFSFFITRFLEQYLCISLYLLYNSLLDEDCKSESLFSIIVSVILLIRVSLSPSLTIENFGR